MLSLASDVIGEFRDEKTKSLLGCPREIQAAVTVSQYQEPDRSVRTVIRCCCCGRRGQNNESRGKEKFQVDKPRWLPTTECPRGHFIPGDFSSPGPLGHPLHPPISHPSVPHGADQMTALVTRGVVRSNQWVNPQLRTGVHGPSQGGHAGC